MVMKKNRISQVLAGVAMTAALLLAVACSCDDTTTKEPEPQPDQPDIPVVHPMEQRIKECTAPGSDARPSWVMDTSLYDQFEQTMAVQVVPQKFLNEYIGDDDLICAMAGGQIRALSGAEKTDGKYYFPLVVAGNGSEGKITISYYCSQLKRIYTAEDWVTFDERLTPTILGEPLEIVFFKDIDEWQKMQDDENYY